MAMDPLGWTVCTAVAYLIGGIPFGVLISCARGVDIRQEGSRNIGATNVWRVLGAPLGLVCFLLDVAKGAVPVIVVGRFSGLVGMDASSMPVGDQSWWLLVAMATVAGHMYSPWLRLGGGKGVATTLGALAATWPLLTLPVCVAVVIWMLTVTLWRTVSVASMAAAAALPLAWLSMLTLDGDASLGDRLSSGWPPLAVTSALAVLVFVKHRENIARLRHGEEPRIGD